MFRTTLLVALAMASTAIADDGCLSEPWTLLGECENGITAGGWVAAGFTSNAHGNRTGTGNLPLGMNSVADGPVVNQLYAYVEKVPDNGCDCFDWGFRFDYLFGTDAPDLQAFGDGDFDFGWNSSRDYGSAISQLYADFAHDDWNLRVGRFYTLIGYEWSETVENFFYSRSYAFYYGEPSSHTGFLASCEAYENWAFHGGWVMGWDSGFRNLLNASTFLGGVTWTACDDIVVTYAVNTGDFGDGVGRKGSQSNEGSIFNHSIVLEMTLTECLAYALVHEMGDNRGLGVDNNEWYALAQYLTYEINDTWSAGFRFEWFRDDDGARVGVNNAQEGSYYATTLGLKWLPLPNLTVRPEIRWDWFDGVGLPFDGVNGNGTQGRMFTGGLDAIVVY